MMFLLINLFVFKGRDLNRLLKDIFNIILQTCAVLQ